MTRIRNIRLALLSAIVALLAIGPVAPARAAKLAKIDSREVKILLRAEAFDSSATFFLKSLELLRALSSAQSIDFHETSAATMKTREIRYFDTEDFALRRKGWILRQRVKTRGSRRADHAELALKFRSSIRETVVEAGVEADSRYVSKTAFEEDIHPVEEKGPWRSTYARRCKIKDLPIWEAPTISDVGGIFPAIGRIGLDPSEGLEAVGGPLLEKRIDPGYLDFGNGVMADVEIAWLQEPSGKGVVGEISYKYPFLKNSGSVSSIWASLQFLPALRKSLGEAWQPGSGKTSFIFERAGYQKP